MASDERGPGWQGTPLDGGVETETAQIDTTQDRQQLAAAGGTAVEIGGVAIRHGGVALIGGQLQLVGAGIEIADGGDIRASGSGVVLGRAINITKVSEPA